MKTAQEILDKVSYAIDELEKELSNMEKQDIGSNTGMLGIQKIIDVEKVKSEIKALKEVRMYIKF